MIHRHSFIKIVSYVFIFTGLLFGLWAVFAGNFMSGDIRNADYEKAQRLGYFVSAAVLPLFSIGSTLLIIENLFISGRQNFTTNFLKLLDMYAKSVDSIDTTIHGCVMDEIDAKKKTFFDIFAEVVATDFTFCNQYRHSQSSPPVCLSISENLGKKFCSKSGSDLLIAIYDYHFQLIRAMLGIACEVYFIP